MRVPWLRRRKTCLLVGLLLLPALATRMLVPPGFMPGTGADGAPSMQMCHGAGPLPGAAQPATSNDGHAPGDRAHHEAPCVFAAAGSAAPPPSRGSRSRHATSSRRRASRARVHRRPAASSPRPGRPRTPDRLPSSLEARRPTDPGRLPRRPVSRVCGRCLLAAALPPRPAGAAVVDRTTGSWSPDDVKFRKSCSVALAVALALHVAAGVAADDSAELEELIVTARRILTPGLGVGNARHGGDRAQARPHQRHRQPAEEHPRRGYLWRRRRLEPAGDPRPRRRSPAHAGRRRRHRGRLPQPHEPAAVLHRSDRRRRHRRLRRCHSGERRRRQHRRHHPGALGGPAVRRDRRQSRCRGMPARSTAATATPGAAISSGTYATERPEPRLHRLIRAVGQLPVRRRLQGLHVHRASGSHAADRRSRLDGLRVEQPVRAARLAQRRPPARLHLQLPGRSRRRAIPTSAWT